MSGSKTGKWKIIWTEPAVHDLSEIAEYIGRDSQHYAARIVQAVYGLAENLSMFPLKGRIVPEFGQENLREIIYQSYRIIYKIEPERLAILSIVHTSRDLIELPQKEPWDIG